MGDMFIIGHIIIDPPLTHDEVICDSHRMDFGNPARSPGEWVWPGVVIRTRSVTVDTKYGQLAARTGIAIVGPSYESNGSDLPEDVQKIVDKFRTAPDGTVRRWTGFLECHWANEETFRIAVDDNGRVFEVKPVFPGIDGPLPPLPGEEK